MSVLPQLGIGLLSIIVIVLGAEKVVNKMQRVAKYYGISNVVIAMTVISIGTSLPEISLHIVGSLNILSNPAVMNEVSGTVLGMNIGSDVVQQTLIMGGVVFLAAFMKGRDNMVFTHEFIKRNYLPMIGAHVIVLLLALNRVISHLDGFLLISVFSGYMYYLYRKRDDKLLRAGDAKPSEKPRLDLLIALSAMAALVYFSDVFLSVVENLIAATGLSGSMIGVVTVGMVSAMPEMVTAISGLRNNAEGISLGTLIGSNITNPLLGIGIGAAISSYSVPSPLILWDLPVQILTASVLVIYLWNKEMVGEMFSDLFSILGLEKLSEKTGEMENGVLTAVGGLALILVYISYIGVRAVFFSVDFI